MNAHDVPIVNMGVVSTQKKTMTIKITNIVNKSLITDVPYKQIKK